MNELSDKLKEEFKDKEYAHAYANEFLNANIATQIKVLREQREMTQENLASISGMQQARISVLENVNNSMWSISTLQRLAEAFDVTLKVSFESFATRIEDVQQLDRASLERPSREEALSQMDKQKQQTQVVYQAGYLIPGQPITMAGSYAIATGDVIVLPDKTEIGVASANVELSEAA